ncbi:MAG: helix-turn-helix domain-containing protein [Bacteroidota bacterium]
MKKQHVELTEEDRIKLEERLSKDTLSAKVRKRILGLLALDRGHSYQAAQKELKTTHITLSTWAKKYKENGLDFLEDKPRSGRPKGLSETDRAKITALACTKAPKGYDRWSLRLLADKAVELEYVEKISHNTVGQILKKTN